MIKKFLDDDCDYLSNVHPPSYPDGFDVEVINFAALKKAWLNASSSLEREHVTLYLKNSDEFNVLEDIISGTGISRMFETKTGNKVKSEEVFSLSLNGDNNAKEVIDIFTIAFARTLSDLSLTFSSGGGIILAVSLSRSFLSIANKDLFNKHFLDGKSDIHKEILNKIDIKVINKGYTCLFGSLNYVNNIQSV